MFIEIQNGSLFNADHAKCFYKSSCNHTNNGDEKDVLSYYIKAESIIPTIDPVTIATFSKESDRDAAFKKLSEALNAQ